MEPRVESQSLFKTDNFIAVAGCRSTSRTDGSSSSRGQMGHQAEEDRRDISQQRIFRKSDGRGLTGHQTATKFKNSKTQCCRAATFFGGSGSGCPKFLEPTSAPTYLGRLRLQAKKAAPAPYTNIFHFELLKSKLLIQVYFGPYLPF